MQVILAQIVLTHHCPQFVHLLIHKRQIELVAQAQVLEHLPKNVKLLLLLLHQQCALRRVLLLHVYLDGLELLKQEHDVRDLYAAHFC